MARLAESYLHMTIEMSAGDQSALAEHLQSMARKIFVDVYNYDGDVVVELRDGSLKAWVTATGISLTVLMSGYGSFRQSIDYLVRDAQMFDERVRDAVLSVGVQEEEIAVFQRRLGVIGRIRRVLIRIDRIDDLDASERHAELSRIKAMLFDIVVELDDPEDQKLHLSNVPTALVRHFQEESTEEQDAPAERPEMPPAYASRAEDWDLNGANRMTHKVQVEGPKLLSYEPLVKFDSEMGKIVRPKVESEIRLLPKPLQTKGD